MPNYRAIDIAQYVIGFFHEREDLITNLKLQKLLYYVQGWHLALCDEAVFPEAIEAWVHGPVVREVYDAYKNYRWNPISEAVTVPALPDALRSLIDEVLGVYGMESAFALEYRTHHEPPWLTARTGIRQDEPSNNIIQPKWMQTYFRELADAEE